MQQLSTSACSQDALTLRAMTPYVALGLQSGSIPPGRPPPLSEAGLPGRERDGYDLCTMPAQLLRAACKDARTPLPVSGTDAITTSSANLFGLFPTDGAY